MLRGPSVTRRPPPSSQGVTVEEVIAAKERGVTPKEVVAAKKEGVTPQEVVEVKDAGLNVEDAVEAKKEGLEAPEHPRNEESTPGQTSSSAKALCGRTL